MATHGPAQPIEEALEKAKTVAYCRAAAPAKKEESV